jgi:F-type H+-transporting ATPase subunit delta
VPSETIGVIADRYAGALYELADSQSALDTVAKDLRSLRAMLADSADLRRLVGSPVLSRADQAKAIATVASAARLSDLTLRFLGLAARNRRLMILSAVIDAYLGRLASRRGEKTAQVVSASVLSSAQTASLASALRSVYGGSVSVETVVDPGLLGGLVVKVGSQMFDSSLRTKLQHLKLAMKGVG